MVFLLIRVDWMVDYQGMVCLAGNQVWWTWEVEDVFRKVRQGSKQGMKEYAKKQHTQIDDLVVKVSHILDTSCQGGSYCRHLLSRWIIFYTLLYVNFNMLSLQVRSPLTKNERAKFNSVLIIEVHARDIIDGFVRDRYSMLLNDRIH